MRIQGSDPDIQTVVQRIMRGDIDLQPDFQRGEVWSDAKKRRLIDSILRHWNVPPIHVIQVPDTEKYEVLDGQQRLATIRDFVLNKLKIDGSLEPLDESISHLDGLTFAELSESWRRRFNQFTLRLFVISDYAPDEPAELFFRLNQPTSLTAAEQRNAFFGPTRQQVKDLTNLFEELGLTKNEIGFSNSRMAYDEVLSRLCMTLDSGTLQAKVTASILASKYRSRQPFSENTVSLVESTVRFFASARRSIHFPPIRFNKATLFSWLCFISGLHPFEDQVPEPEGFAEFLRRFEELRVDPKAERLGVARNYLFNEFNDRATSRVFDVSSVILRDAVLWLMFEDFMASRDNTAFPYAGRAFALRGTVSKLFALSTESEVEQHFTHFLKSSEWGREL